MADADFPNPHANNLRLIHVLDIVDALPRRRADMGSASSIRVPPTTST